MWLPNSRGNFYSRKHISKNPDDPQSGFWNFTWFEMGIFDNPTVIDYILKLTNNVKLNYVGHSQSTTTIMVLLSERPEYNQKIGGASLLAPIGYLTHVDKIYKIAAQVGHTLAVISLIFVFIILIKFICITN